MTTTMMTIEASKRASRRLFQTALLGIISQYSYSETLHLAAASNFTLPLREIAQSFEAQSPHKLVVSYGSSGKLYAQIKHGAPFEVFLSADQDKPERLVTEGLADGASRFTYAVGALALWSPNAERFSGSPDDLQVEGVRKIALANPRLAPYGEAALAVIKGLSLQDKLGKRLVYGDNIAQTYQFVHSGNADLGFVSQSQIIQEGEVVQGTAWLIPESMHPAIKQDAVILNKGLKNPASTAFIEYLKAPGSVQTLQAFGYRQP